MTARITDYKNRALVFSAEGVNYAIGLPYVVETVQALPITKVPCVPDCVKGICNLRGQIVPVVDLIGYFSGVDSGASDCRCFLVVDVDGCSAGLLIDNVLKVVPVSDGSALGTTDSPACGFEKYVLATLDREEGKIIVIDIAKILKDITEKR